MRALLILLLLICFKPNYGQTNYYSFNTDSIFSEESVRSAYMTVSKRLPNNVTLKPIIYHRITKNDSIINYIEFSMTQKDTASLFENGQKEPKESNLKQDRFELTFLQDSLFLLLGKKLPEFSLKDLNGDIFSSNQLIGKPALINYWAIYCKPCVEEIPDLNKLQQKYGNEMNFIAIAESACSEGELEIFLKKKPFTFKILTLADAYKNELKIQAIPVNIFIDKNGIVQNIQKNYPMDDGKGKTKNYFERIIKEMIN